MVCQHVAKLISLAYTSVMRNNFISFVLLILVIPGCTTTHFLGQAARGQWRIQHHATPIDRVLAQDDLNIHTRHLLRRIPEIKTYAQAHGLQATDNYEHYMAVEGDAVVWVVTACPPLSLQPKTWTFPIAGSFTYLGWFQEGAARKHANKLRRKGFDVHLRGADAYSTLGHFRDPVFSTMLKPGLMGGTSLAHTLFHESAHVTVFIKGQSYFNESVAQFIANRLTREYVEDTFGTNAMEVKAYQTRTTQIVAYTGHFNEAFIALETLYASEASGEVKQKKKVEILGTLQNTLQLKKRPNNADMIGYRTYDSGREGFAELLEACEHDWDLFIARVSQLQPNDFAEPHQKDYSAVVHALASRE